MKPSPIFVYATLALSLASFAVAEIAPKRSGESLNTDQSSEVLSKEIFVCDDVCVIDCVANISDVVTNELKVLATMGFEPSSVPQKQFLM